jgi:hypothetical protein
MTTTTGRDLGHGVRLLPSEGGGLIVLSEMLDLGWRVRQAELPGSAVTVDGESFEVVDRQPWREGDRWLLDPWRGEDVMRVVLPLSESSIGQVAETQAEAAKAKRLRLWMWLFAPLLGLAVSPWQRRWRDRWGFPATGATIASAIVELLLGTACSIELLAGMAGASIYPWMPRPLLFVGLYLVIEGLVRLAQVFSDSEPVGSFAGLLASLVERQEPTPRAVAPAPTVERYDAEAGELELLSPTQRRDWERPGLLPYRGSVFALEATRRLGEEWVYVFGRIELRSEGGWRRHHLLPPVSRRETGVDSGEPGLAMLVLLSVLNTLAPARYQQRWAATVDVPATWFTIAGAAAELIGGLVNLAGGKGSGGMALLINLFFILEAAVRLAWVVLRGSPLGSALGLPLAPLLDRLLPEG